MPRKPREELAGGVFHVFARGNDRRAIFNDDRDRALYLAILGRVVRRQGWLCLGYCLMPNHIHLLLETPQPNLGDGMRRLHGDYAQRFNACRGGCGHVFQGRYGAKRIENDPHFLVTARYVARNPVESGLAQRPGAYRWSSHAALTHRRPTPAWLAAERVFDLFGGDERYATFVDAG